MTSQSGQPSPRTRGRINHPLRAFLPVLGFNLVVGVIAYFIAFVMSYGFRDTVDLPEHLMFLVLVAAFAAVGGLTALLATTWEPEARASQLLAFGVLASFSLNATTVGVGSIVSALNKAQGSVSASFSTTTDVLVALGLFAVAGGCAALTRTISGAAGNQLDH